MTEDTSTDTLPDAHALAADTEQTSEAEFRDLDAVEAETAEPADETTQDKAEPDPEGEQPEGEDEPEPEEKPKKKLSGSERLKRRIAFLEAELAERRPAPVADGDALARAVEAEIGAPPQEQDFEGDYLAFERALTVYETEKRIVARDVKRQLATQQARAQEAAHETIADHMDRLEELEKAAPGSKEKLAKAAKSGLAPSDAVANLVLESDKSAHLAVHLAENPTLLDRLNRMSPMQANREIGRLEARLSSPPPRKATQAPKPVAPVKGAARPSFDPNKASVGDLAKYLGIKG